MPRIERASRTAEAPEASDRPRSQEPVYTFLEIAGMLKVSHDTARDMFRDEPGLLVYGSPRSSGKKRKYRTIRVPQHVFERVYKRLQQTA